MLGFFGDNVIITEPREQEIADAINAVVEIVNISHENKGHLSNISERSMGTWKDIFSTVKN